MNGSLQLCCMTITQSSCGTFDMKGNRFSFFASHSSQRLAWTLYYIHIHIGWDGFVDNVDELLDHK